MIQKIYSSKTIIALSLSFISLFVLLFFLSSKEHTANTKAEIYITANELIDAYVSDEKKANSMYTNKLLEVSGTLKSITHLNNRNTIILDNDGDSSGIICDLSDIESNKLTNLKKNQKIKVKGLCKGFLKDVVLLNCYIEINE
jgi:hypothetical protein